MKTRFCRLFAALMAIMITYGASAQTAEVELGSETRLPIPRYVSLKGSEANVRRGPSRSHRIDWHYVRRGLPLRVTAEFDNWRRVEDMDGQGGWIHFTLLSGIRTVIVTEDMTPLRSRPRDNAPEVARLEEGVIGYIVECAQGWCEIEVEDIQGWLPTSAVWGVEPNEVLD